MDSKIERAIEQLREAILLEHHELVDKHRKRYEQLQAEIKQLKKALKKYGKHLKEPECELYWAKGEYIATRFNCTCGFSKALKGE